MRRGPGEPPRGHPRPGAGSRVRVWRTPRAGDRSRKRGFLVDQGESEDDTRALARLGMDLEPATSRRRPIAEVRETEMPWGSAAVRIEARAVVLDRQDDLTV